MAVPLNITSALPILKRIWLPFLNLIGEKNEVRIILTAPDYVEFRVFWGFISYTKGEKREFIITGTDSYVKKGVSSMSKRNLDVKTILLG